MFGYRLVRETDWTDLQGDLKAARALERALHEETKALAAEARSAKTLYEALLSRLNQLELENAQYRNKLTGLPAIAPQLAKGQPLEGSAIGAGVDLFEDIGDARALSLRDRGILHDDVPIPDPPAAAALTAGLVGG